MITVGMLYSKEDNFSKVRSDLLVGPMLLESINFVRFLSENIQSDLKIFAQECIQGDWIDIKEPFCPDVLLDFTLPNSSRSKEEKLLLNKLPHNKRIDQNSYELLQLLIQDDDFKEVIVPIKGISSFSEIKEILKISKKIIIKSKNNTIQPKIIVIFKKGHKWKISLPYEERLLTLKELEVFLNDLDLDGYFIQDYVEALSKEKRSIAFNLVVQQRFDGSWLSPIVRGIHSTRGPIASLCSGGEFIGTPLLMDDVTYFQFPSRYKRGLHINLKLQRLSVCIARRLEELIEGAPCSIGLKFLLDEKLMPKLVNIEPRTIGYSAPGRHLEFYRNIVQFSQGLMKEQEISSKRKKLESKHKEDKTIPPYGITSRKILKPIECDTILENNTQWIDVSIGHGSRQFIHDICQAKDQRNVFLSFRVGFALNDRVQGYRQSILALEDYLGTGIIRWSETEYMRSIRPPLLQKQYEQIEPYLVGGDNLDLMWIEDIELGLRGLNQSEQDKALNNMIEWFEKMCHLGQAKQWGVIFFNVRNKPAFELLKKLQLLSKNCKYFTTIATRMKTADLLTLKMLHEMNFNVVVLSEDILEEEIEEFSSNMSLLRVYNQLNFNKVGM